MEAILSLSVIDPNPQILDSISLESLCLVTEMKNDDHFSKVVIGGAEGMVLDYLKKIVEPILKEISQLQTLFKGTGCSTAIVQP